jgi:hypothetical protein
MDKTDFEQDKGWNRQDFAHTALHNKTSLSTPFSTEKTTIVPTELCYHIQVAKVCFFHMPFDVMAKKEKAITVSLPDNVCRPL